MYPPSSCLNEPDNKSFIFQIGSMPQATLDAFNRASAQQQAALTQRLATLERLLAQLHPSAAAALGQSSAAAGAQTDAPQPRQLHLASAPAPALSPFAAGEQD